MMRAPRALKSMCIWVPIRPGGQWCWAGPSLPAWFPCPDLSTDNDLFLLVVPLAFASCISIHVNSTFKIVDPLGGFLSCHYERSLFMPGSISCSTEKRGQVPRMSNGRPLPLHFFHAQFLQFQNLSVKLIHSKVDFCWQCTSMNRNWCRLCDPATRPVTLRCPRSLSSGPRMPPVRFTCNGWTWQCFIPFTQRWVNCGPQTKSCLPTI